MANVKTTTSTTRDWYSNKYQNVLLQRNLFAIFTICALIAVVIAVFFVKNITESKSFEPFIIEMEDKTGRIQVVNATGNDWTRDEAIKRFYLNSFLSVSEGFNYATYKSDMIKLGLFTDQNIYRTLYSRLSERNERSPINTFRANTGYMYIVIKSMIFLSPNSSSVRFKIVNTTPNGVFPPERHLVAYIEFGFSQTLALTETERLINPLGFQVTKYRLDNDLTQ